MKEAFESKGSRVNLLKTKVIMSGWKREMLQSKVNPYAKCGKKVMVISVLCTECTVINRCRQM